MKIIGRFEYPAVAPYLTLSKRSKTAIQRILIQIIFWSKINCLKTKNSNFKR